MCNLPGKACQNAAHCESTWKYQQIQGKMPIPEYLQLAEHMNVPTPTNVSHGHVNTHVHYMAILVTMWFSLTEVHGQAVGIVIQIADYKAAINHQTNQGKFIA